jgi:hypothetical protein
VWRRWQAELAPDRRDGPLDRPVCRVQPRLVGVKLTQGRGRRRGGGQPRPALVDPVQIARGLLGLGSESDSEQAAVKQPLGGRGVTQIGPGAGEVVAVALLQRVQVRFQPPVSGSCEHQVAGRQLAPGRADRESAAGGGP